MSRRRTCLQAIVDLMSDYQPRTSEQIADETGFSHGRVRAELAKHLSYETARTNVRGGGSVTWHQLRRHEIKPMKQQRES